MADTTYRSPAEVREQAKKRADAAADAHTAAWQAYLQPNGVLRNRFGIEDARRLEVMERHYTASRTEQIAHGAAGPFAHTVAGYKTLHRHLFQDVYEWAGRVRTVNMHRQDQREDGTDRTSSYIAARFIEQGLHATFEQLKPALPRLRAEALKEPAERSVKLVAEVAAYHVGALNYVHAFRDGNGRAMRQRVAHLAAEAGLHFDQAKLDRDRWNEGSHRINADPRDAKLLTEAIAAALSPKERLLDREQEACHGERPEQRSQQARKAAEVERGTVTSPKQTRRQKSRGRGDQGIAD